MGKPIAQARMGGVCYSCGRPFHKGEPIWWSRYNRARHQNCAETNNDHPNYVAAHLQGATANLADAPPAEHQHGPAIEYLFADPKGTSKFDQLFFSNPGDMLVRAFELSLEHGQSVGVSRIEESKAVSLFMIAALPNASLIPVAKPIETEVEGPLFEWDGDVAPF